MSGAQGNGIDVAGIERELGVRIESLACDSRRVSQGDVFLAYPGLAADGRAHIGDAARAGAAGVLWDPDGFSWDDEWKVPNVPVARLKRHASFIAGHALGHPSRSMSVYAVTGTEGKTTTSWFIAGLLSAAKGEKVACFGTAGQGLFGDLHPASLTTPDAVELQRGFGDARRAGALSAVVEASSHGISQHRLAGIDYGVAVFTNLGRDHLDYHASHEEYARSKEMLFERPGLEGAAINVDDDFGRRLARDLEGKTSVATYGTGPARAQLLDVEHCPEGMTVRARLDGYEHEWTMPVEGRHNAMNALAAMCAARLGGLRWGEILPAMESLRLPPGRMQRVGDRQAGPAVYVDYAHAPRALERALSHLQEIHPGRRLTCVFGCGGDRDRGKRPEMGRIATRLASRVLVTSDNPRGEDPGRIIADVMEGAGPNAKAVSDRTQAIFTAVREAEPADAVLVAGKGHEKFQIVGDRRVPFDDVAVAEAALRELAP